MDRIILDPLDELELLDEAIEICRSRIGDHHDAWFPTDEAGGAKYEEDLQAALADQLTRQLKHREELEAELGEGQA